MYTTDRLILRAYQSSDDQHLHALNNSFPVQLAQRREPPAPTPLSFVTDTIVPKWFSQAYFHAVITLKSSPETFVGYVCLVPPSVPKNRDAMYVISLKEDKWGKGYGSEVTKWVVDWGFRMGGLHRIWLGVFGSNEGAIKVYEKAGFVHEGRVRKETWINGKWEDTVMMAILDEDWEKMQTEKGKNEQQ